AGAGILRAPLARGIVPEFLRGHAAAGSLSDSGTEVWPMTAPSPRTSAAALVRDIHWIRGALQTAVALEHATMPLYAAAMYSLEVQNYPAYNTLRSVLMEEMLHMAAACNALAAIGGSPRIATLDPAAILTGLPAGIAPELKPRFARLSRRQLDTFMRIESP